MFKYTMKKRKFPFISEESEDAHEDKTDDVEQTRRQSEASVCSLAFGLISAIVVYIDSCF